MLQCNFPDVGPFQFGTKSAQSIFTLSRIGPKKFNKCLKINSDELLLRNKQFKLKEKSLHESLKTMIIYIVYTESAKNGVRF